MEATQQQQLTVEQIKEKAEQLRLRKEKRAKEDAEIAEQERIMAELYKSTQYRQTQIEELATRLREASIVAEELGLTARITLGENNMPVTWTTIPEPKTGEKKKRDQVTREQFDAVRDQLPPKFTASAMAKIVKTHFKLAKSVNGSGICEELSEGPEAILDGSLNDSTKKYEYSFKKQAKGSSKK